MYHAPSAARRRVWGSGAGRQWARWTNFASACPTRLPGHIPLREIDDRTYLGVEVYRVFLLNVRRLFPIFLSLFRLRSYSI